MKPLDAYDTAELKVIYRLLHESIAATPELMDSELLHDLQGLLQARAKADGVDVSLHAQWAAWLNDGPPVRGL